MKKHILILVVAVLVVFSGISNAEAKPQKSNWQIVKQLCQKEGYVNILLVDSNKTTDKEFWRIADRRKGKPYILVEKVVSRSDGTRYGWYRRKGSQKYIIGYNRKVPKGRKVTSYIIWNMKTNYCDDVLYAVDNNRYR